MAIIQDVYQLETAQFQAQIQKVQADYNATAKGANKAGEEGKKFGSETEKGAKQATEGLKQTEKQTGLLGGALKNLSVAVAGAFAVAKIKDFVAQSVQSFAQFEAKMSNVATLVDTSRESIEEMGDKVLEIASRTPVAVDELATALYDIRSAGIDAADAMAVLETSAQLGVAGLATTQEATNLMTSAMNAFASEGMTAEQVADILFKTVKAGKTDIAALATGFGSTAPAIQAAGASLADFQAATAALTTVGTPATQAQNQLRAAMVELQKPGKELQAIFTELGVGSGRELIETTGSMGAAFKAISDEALKSGRSVTEVTSSVEAAAAITALGGTLNETYAATLLDMTDGAAALGDAFDKQAMTTEAAMQSIANSMQTVAISAGKALAPAVNVVAKSLSFLIENADTLIKILKVAGVGIVTYTGITKGAAIAKGIYTAAVKLATAVTKGFNTAVKGSPIGLIASLVASAAASFLLFNDRTEEAIENNSELANSIKSVEQNGNEEIVMMRKAFEQLKKTNAGSKERQAMIDQINKTYPVQLKNLEDEEEFLNQIAIAQEKIVAGIKEKVAMRVQEAKYEDVIRRQLQLEQRIAEETDNLNKKKQQQLMSTDANSVAMNKLSTEIRTQEALLKGMQAELANVNGEMAALDEETKDLIPTMETFGETTEPATTNAKRGFDALNEQIGLLKKQLEDEAFAGMIRPETVKQLRDLENQLARTALRMDEALNGAIQLGEVDILPDGLPDFSDIMGELPQLMGETAQEIDEEFNSRMESMFETNMDRMKKYAEEQTEIEIGLREGLMKSQELFSSAISDILSVIGDESSEFADFAKALAVFDVAMKTAVAIGNAIAGATAAAAATGAGAPFVLAGYIASMIGTVVASFAQVSSILAAEPPRFFEGTASVGLGGNKPGRDTIPAMLNEGEAVIPTDDNRAYPGLAQAWIGGDLDRYIHKNWVAPQLREKERERAERELNAIGQMMVQGFDDYRLHKDNREMIGVMRNGFATLRESRKKVRGRS